MTITITLSADAERKLAEQAARSGVTPEAYASRLIESELNGGRKAPRSPSTSGDGAAPAQRLAEVDFWRPATLDELAAAQKGAMLCTKPANLNYWTL